MKRAACLLALAVLAAGAGAQADKAAQQAQEQRHGDPQSQEEQAGNAALQAVRKPGEHAVEGQPQGQPEQQAKDRQARDREAKDQQAPKQKGRQPPRRRAVPAIIGTMPAPSAPQAYGPVLNPSPMPAPAPGGSPPPGQIKQCIGSQCTDASGKSYQIGVGNAGTDSNGRLCNRSGATVQCF
ncbi:hypothetical protein GCM10027321_27800 [Massilia terrae]|uniref:Uncharacterized protein n=1 Tax=Massilia terrae TaxID=1811224 RepID=A0ABT2CYM4_9BURK|nr:hypothetical protein [Massilia terrae]MCS0659072.1 hypothetical protein [Massilia terrae]